MPVCDVTNRARKELAPGVVTQTYWAQKLLLSRVEMAPNAVVPTHSHPHEQGLIVLSGALELLIDGGKELLTTGALYLIPGDVEHCAIAGPAGCTVVDVFSPVREALQY